MNLKEKQLAFLNETIAHYNSGNRCVNDAGDCVYAPIKNKSEGCAIGRKIPVELATMFDSNEFKGSCEPNEGWTVNNDEVFNKLPDELKELGKLFLRSMQKLHDNSLNWNSEGLSDHYGGVAVKEIKFKYELG